MTMVTRSSASKQEENGDVDITPIKAPTRSKQGKQAKLQATIARMVKEAIRKNSRVEKKPEKGKPETRKSKRTVAPNDDDDVHRQLVHHAEQLRKLQQQKDQAGEAQDEFLVRCMYEIKMAKLPPANKIDVDNPQLNGNGYGWGIIIHHNKVTNADIKKKFTRVIGPFYQQLEQALEKRFVLRTMDESLRCLMREKIHSIMWFLPAIVSMWRTLPSRTPSSTCRTSRKV